MIIFLCEFSTFSACFRPKLTQIVAAGSLLVLKFKDKLAVAFLFLYTCFSGPDIFHVIRNFLPSERITSSEVFSGQ